MVTMLLLAALTTTALTTTTLSPALSAAQDLLKVDLAGYRLVWRDEFSGNQLDATKWQAPTMERQNASSRWTPSAVALQDGKLILKAIPTPNTTGGPRYDCGAVRSRPDYDVSRTYFQQAKGYFEIRAKLLKNLRADTWFAFWILAGEMKDNQTDSRRGTEIDILETFSITQNLANHAIHWGGYGPTLNSASIPSTPRPFLQDGSFHTYGLLWTDDEYVFTVDREIVARTTAKGLGRKDKVLSSGTCLQPGYLKLTVEAAPWGGATGQWEPEPYQPDQAEVDWIRVYKKES